MWRKGSYTKGKVVFGLIALWIAATVGGAYAAPDYPVRPIILQVPWPPGGASDVMARILASVAEKKLGQAIVVINKAGAGSQVVLAETARAKTEGKMPWGQLGALQAFVGLLGSSVGSGEHGPAFSQEGSLEKGI